MPGRRSPRKATFAAVDADLGALCLRVGLLGAATPRDAHLERRRLLADYERGRERLPEWTYAPAPRADILRDLDGVCERVQGQESGRVGRLYRARVDELRLEAEAAEAVGTPLFAERALARFPLASPPAAAKADQLAASWLLLDEPAPSVPRLLSDDRDPRSLVSRLRAEVSRRNLPFKVQTSPSLSALAAVSGDTLWVAEGRALSLDDIERTVMHEVEGHVVPRMRARSMALGLFSIGTAHGSDDQEGYALWLEEARGFSSPARRRELGGRHLAVALMQRGADFVEVVRSLRDEASLGLDTSLRIAERAFRGSLGRTPGLGRERVYLDAFLRIKRHLDASPRDEAVLSSGQVAVDAIDTLRPWTV
jgi:hypothetical protein